MLSQKQGKSIGRINKWSLAGISGKIVPSAIDLLEHKKTAHYQQAMNGFSIYNVIS
jgi:hypothetical protein